MTTKVVSSNALDTTLYDKICQWLAAGRWFSLGTLVSSTNKTDRHDISKLLLTVVLNTIILTLCMTNTCENGFCIQFHALYIISCQLAPIFVVFLSILNITYILSFQASYTLLLQLAPILLLVFLSILSSFLVGEPMYNLQQSE